jgi:Cu/Ag efflux protein CusF
MKRTLVAWTIALLAGAVLAQTPTSSGVVTKLDKEAQKVTLKHSEIKNLDMPAMTMAFRVRDAQLLSDLAVGDRVRFIAERVDGQYVLTAISKAP